MLPKTQPACNIFMVYSGGMTFSVWVIIKIKVIQIHGTVNNRTECLIYCYDYIANFTEQFVVNFFKLKTGTVNLNTGTRKSVSVLIK